VPVLLNALINKLVIWPLVWLASVLFFRSGNQARWIYEKIHTPRSLYLTIRNILNFRLNIPRIAGWISVSIEPVATCNLSCKYCARAKDKQWISPRPEFMDWELYTKIIDEMPDTVETISFAGIGEPLLHPRIVDMINYAGKSGRRVYMFTNGKLLKGELIQKLAASALTALNVSLEPDAESARYYRNVDYEEIAGNIRAFHAAKSARQAVNISLVMNEMHAEKIKGFSEKWNGIVDHLKISPQLGFTDTGENKAPHSCSELWRGNMDIKTNGNISICCFDSMEKLVIANAQTVPLKSVIDSTKLRELLSSMIKGDMPDLCRKCRANTFSNPRISRMSRKGIK
jgi:sulfatase maturation enzyme AslB (radical SAM superfamily)